MPRSHGNISDLSLSCCVVPQAYRSISKCVAAICDSVPGETFTTVEKFVNDVKVGSRTGEQA